MKVMLDRVTQRVGAETHLHPITLELVPGTLTVLLGATRAGKTSLMRIMAGLDAPTSGRVFVDGVDVTGRPVRERNIAMVYQQFINYPSLTVAENIASPLRRQRGAAIAAQDIDARVRAIATRLRIDPFLARLPAQLSGGQQQRVALARALAKRAPLMLLDEPLVNLDYKLREELRDELTQLFATGESTVVYATTDPTEALLLGGHTAVLDRGELLQYGPTPDVFHAPNSLRVARAFSDPPMTLVRGTLSATGVTLANGHDWPLPQLSRGFPAGPSIPSIAPDGSAACTVGMRAGALRTLYREGDESLTGTVALADIAGSDTFIHVDSAIGMVVAQMPGVHRFGLGAAIKLYVDPAQLYLFGADERLLHAPTRRPGSSLTIGSS